MDFTALLVDNVINRNEPNFPEVKITDTMEIRLN